MTETLLLILFKITTIVECSHGFYGQQCEKRCGKCKGGMICNTSSGICPDGCHEHWSPPSCTGKNRDRF